MFQYQYKRKPSVRNSEEIKKVPHQNLNHRSQPVNCRLPDENLTTLPTCNRKWFWKKKIYKNTSQLAVNRWSGLMTTVGPKMIRTASDYEFCFLLKVTQSFHQMVCFSGHVDLFMDIDSGRVFSPQSPLRSGDRLARTRKSHLTKHTVCSSKTLAIRHFGYFGAYSHVSNSILWFKVFWGLMHYKCMMPSQDLCKNRDLGSRASPASDINTLKFLRTKEGPELRFRKPSQPEWPGS